MEKNRLMEVLKDSTCLISKGAKTSSRLPKIPLLLWGLMNFQGDPGVDQLDQVDCQFLTIGVNKSQAEKHRATFIEFLETYPEPNKLSDGPTYKHLATIVGDDITALRVFGLGQVLGLWNVVLPGQLGVEDEELADEAADLGLIVVTGYQTKNAGTLLHAAAS